MTNKKGKNMAIIFRNIIMTSSCFDFRMPQDVRPCRHPEAWLKRVETVGLACRKQGFDLLLAIDIIIACLAENAIHLFVPSFRSCRQESAVTKTKSRPGVHPPGGATLE